MIEIELTIVRMTKTKEPVAIFNRFDCIFRLGQNVDQVTDPSLCEYADVEITCSLEVFFYKTFKSKNDDSEFFDNASLGYDFLSEAQDKFDSSDTEWCEFPSGFDYVSSHGDATDRLLKSEVPF